LIKLGKEISIKGLFFSHQSIEDLFAELVPKVENFFLLSLTHRTNKRGSLALVSLLSPVWLKPDPALVAVGPLG
jgi:hypothetical protein